MEMFEPFLSLGVAVAAGLLIGLERERSAPKDPRQESFLGGARTHPLLALVGALGALLARQLGAGVLLVSLGALVALLLVSYVDDVRRGADRGITSEAAFLVTFLLGALSTSRGVVEPASHRVFVVAATAVVATLLLSAKPALHPLVERISREDVTATLKFLIVAVVVLPLLPNRAMGPLQALNPREVGLMVLLIAGVSFAGYAAIRLLGARKGLGLTGIVGGLVSSTAVTISLSSRAKTRPQIATPLAVAVLLASTIMFARILVLVAAVNPGLLVPLAVPMSAMLVAGLIGSAVLYRGAKLSAGNGSEVSFANPFELSKAVEFGVYFALVLIGTKAASIYLGARGTYVAGVIAGLADVDSITVSMAQLAKGHVPRSVAATTIFLAAASNTLAKAVLAAALGGWSFAKRLAVPFLIMLAAGAITLPRSPLE